MTLKCDVEIKHATSPFLAKNWVQKEKAHTWGCNNE